jgi:hypothetical protein
MQARYRCATSPKKWQSEEYRKKNEKEGNQAGEM